MIPHKICFPTFETFTWLRGVSSRLWLDHRSHSETFPSLSPLIVSKRSILYRHIPASVIFRSLQGLEKQAAEILLPEGCSHRLRFSADRCGTDDLLLARSGEVRCLDSVKLCACTGNSCERLAKCPQRIKRVSLRLE